jgi:hypothetical protein
MRLAAAKEIAAAQRWAQSTGLTAVAELAGLQALGGRQGAAWALPLPAVALPWVPLPAGLETYIRYLSTSRMTGLVIGGVPWISCGHPS